MLVVGSRIFYCHRMTLDPWSEIIYQKRFHSVVLHCLMFHLSILLLMYLLFVYQNML